MRFYQSDLAFDYLGVQVKEKSRIMPQLRNQVGSRAISERGNMRPLAIIAWI